MVNFSSNVEQNEWKLQRERERHNAITVFPRIQGANFYYLHFSIVEIDVSLTCLACDLRQQIIRYE
jgi:hypothetical protein